jgi:hypothetical protein
MLGVAAVIVVNEVLRSHSNEELRSHSNEVLRSQARKWLLKCTVTSKKASV